MAIPEKVERALTEYRDAVEQGVNTDSWAREVRARATLIQAIEQAIADGKRDEHKTLAAIAREILIVVPEERLGRQSLALFAERLEALSVAAPAAAETKAP